MHPRQLHQRQQFDAAAAARRRRIALWLEHLERLINTPARSDDERLAKQEALELMRQARQE